MTTKKKKFLKPPLAPVADTTVMQAASHTTLETQQDNVNQDEAKDVMKKISVQMQQQWRQAIAQTATAC
eukprot:11917592-Karenia_brevis.AAC.1